MKLFIAVLSLIGMAGFALACLITATYAWLVVFYRIWLGAQSLCARVGIRLG